MKKLLYFEMNQVKCCSTTTVGHNNGMAKSWLKTPVFLSITIKVSYVFLLKLACLLYAYTLTSMPSFSKIHEKQLTLPESHRDFMNTLLPGRRSPQFVVPRSHKLLKVTKVEILVTLCDIKSCLIMRQCRGANSLRSRVTTVRYGQRPQQSRCLWEAICGWKLSEFVVVKGHNLWKVTNLKIMVTLSNTMPDGW